MLQIDIDTQLKNLNHWHLEENQAFPEICKSYHFSSYVDGLKLLQSIAHYAEDINHHPNLKLGFKTLTVSWTTHDEKGLTMRDFECAQHCDHLYDNMGKQC
jgi:4a-hydroxytetrahydrobiopterin dehydratase